MITFLEKVPKKMQALKAFSLAICFCLSVFASNVLAEDQKTKILVSDPWLYMAVRFIGGVYWDVHPLYFWEEGGKLVRVSSVTRGAYVFVPYRDKKEIKRLGIPLNYEKLVPIYENKPSSLEECYFLDPSVLSFVALGVMRSLSAIDPEHYTYYQRRLAEFQTRLDSVVRVGRQLLWNVEIFDFTGFSECWLRAISSKGRRVFKNQEELNAVTPEKLKSIISYVKANKGIILFSLNFPEDLLSTFDKVPFAVKLKYPSENQDFFVYLYELNLSIWNTFRSAN